MKKLLRNIMHLYYVIIGIKVLLKGTANLIAVYILVFLILKIGHVVDWSYSYIVIPFIIQCIAAGIYVFIERKYLDKAYNDLIKYEYSKDK